MSEQETTEATTAPEPVEAEVTTALQRQEPAAGEITLASCWRRLGPEGVRVAKQTIAKGASDHQLAVFLFRCAQLGLDPFGGQAWLVVRNGKDGPEMAIQMGIGGYRLAGARTGQVEECVGPEFCGEDGGEWTALWLKAEPPAAARFGIRRRGRPLQWAQVLFRERVQRTREGAPTKFWREMPVTMIGKCAEAEAWRRVFPEMFADAFYTGEDEPVDPPAEPAALRASERDAVMRALSS